MSLLLLRLIKRRGRESWGIIGLERRGGVKKNQSIPIDLLDDDKERRTHIMRLVLRMLTERRKEKGKNYKRHHSIG